MYLKESGLEAWGNSMSQVIVIRPEVHIKFLEVTSDGFRTYAYVLRVIDLDKGWVTICRCGRVLPYLTVLSRLSIKAMYHLKRSLWSKVSFTLCVRPRFLDKFNSPSGNSSRTTEEDNPVQ
ncbi:hypothetical protein Tco_0079746 [Tanacetum coccineum]